MEPRRPRRPRTTVITPDAPAGFEVAILGSAASGVPRRSTGRCRACGRRRSATPVAARRTRRTRRSAADAPATPRRPCRVRPVRQVSYADLIKKFFEIHDPTQGMRQGNDVGTQYRSAIYYTTPEQEQTARELTKVYGEELARRGLGEITTEIRPSSETPYFYAEDAHQQYLAKKPSATAATPTPECVPRPPDGELASGGRRSLGTCSSHDAQMPLRWPPHPRRMPPVSSSRPGRRRQRTPRAGSSGTAEEPRSGPAAPAAARATSVNEAVAVTDHPVHPVGVGFGTDEAEERPALAYERGAGSALMTNPSRSSSPHSSRRRALRFRTVTMGWASSRLARYVDMLCRMLSPRTTRSTSEPRDARKRAACPADGASDHRHGPGDAVPGIELRGRVTNLPELLELPQTWHRETAVTGAGGDDRRPGP